MQKIELIPDLEHCIESVARKKHAELVQILFESSETNREIEEKLESLRIFLETADFKKLRSESERQLIKGKDVRFTVYLEGQMSKYKMHVMHIDRLTVPHKKERL